MRQNGRTMTMGVWYSWMREIRVNLKMQQVIIELHTTGADNVYFNSFQNGFLPLNSNDMITRFIEHFKKYFKSF